MIVDAVLATKQRDMSVTVNVSFNRESNAFCWNKNRRNSSSDLCAHFFFCKMRIIHQNIESLALFCLCEVLVLARNCLCICAKVDTI